MGMLRTWPQTRMSDPKRILNKNQGGGRRHLEVRKSVAIFLLFDQSSPTSVGMLRIWRRTQLLHWHFKFTKLQDGGRRHLEFLKSVAISLLLDQSSINLVWMLIIWLRTRLSNENAHSLRFKMAAAAILNFKLVLPFIYYRTNPHQIWWKCWEFDIKRNC